MAGPPDPLDKREVIYGDDTTDEELRETGDLYFEENYLVDAIEAYEEADYKEGGEKILEKAVQTGDYFLVQRVDENWPNLVDKETWKKAGENAEANGRFTDAIKLYHAGNFSDKRKNVEEELEEEFGHSIPSVVIRDIADAKEKDEVEDS